jgi:starch synthase
MKVRHVKGKKNPRVLVVTPEITYLPHGMGNMSNRLNAKAGGLADVSASLVASLYNLGADVHVTLPHYRQMFSIDVGKLVNNELRVYMSNLSNDRIHMAEDRSFYYCDQVYSNYEQDNFKVALAFQREVINNIIPKVNPDLIHCNDWMTGLIPGFARRLGIPCLFTIHNIHTQKLSLEYIEDRGIDAAEFWKNLYYERSPGNYEETRYNNRVDLLASGIFASHYINSVSPTFLDEIADGRHKFIPDYIRYEINNKKQSGCAVGILNSPDPSNDPETDPRLEVNYDENSFSVGKKKNKMHFQERMGMKVDPDAPLFFWPSRLDPMQKGCQLVTDILFQTISDYWDEGLQVAVVANGSYQQHFYEIAHQHGIYNRLGIVDFTERMSRLGYASSDFMLMPSKFEPCGLPQMVSCLYGSLPIVHDTGGLHDTVQHIDCVNNTGNGFSFETYDTVGLRWAIDQAMEFYHLPQAEKDAQIKRIMVESKSNFNQDVTAGKYIDIYEAMLHRNLVVH